MNQIVRNLVRRKLRSFLTISGIVIGIVALTTMGALANNFNALLDGGAKYIAGYVPVGDASSNGVTGGGVLPLAKQGDIAAVPGVARVFPNIQVAAKPGALQVVSLGLPDYIQSLDPAEYSYSALKITYASGHTLGRGRQRRDRARLELRGRVQQEGGGRHHAAGQALRRKPRLRPAHLHGRRESWTRRRRNPTRARSSA